MAGVAQLDGRELRNLREVAVGVLLATALSPLVPVGVGLPCPLRALTGVPCPLCGMTTSVRAIAGGELPAAMAANPFGIVLVAAALALLLSRPTELRVPAAVVFVVPAASWLYQLHRFGFW